MNKQTTSFVVDKIERRGFIGKRTAIAASVVVLAALGLSGCGNVSFGEQPADPAELLGDNPSLTVDVESLDDDDIASCESTLSQSRGHAHNLIMLLDPSASVTARQRGSLQGQNAMALAQASMRDYGLTVISVTGEGASPQIMLQDASLTKSKYDRDSKKAINLARIAPACVARATSGIKARGTGTDLGAAMSLAAEMVRSSDDVVLVNSDWVWNAGQGGLNEQSVLQDASSVAQAAVASMPLDLKGATVMSSSVANTSTLLSGSARSWMLQYAKGLCGGWNGSETSCKALVLDPVNAERDKGHAKLPEDPIPVFPTGKCEGNSASYELSSSYFEGDSAALTQQANDALADPLAQLQTNPSSTITLTGHTAKLPDNGGDGTELSQRRADVVSAWFASRGIGANRISATGVGDRDSELLNGQPNPADRRIDLRIEGISQCVVR